MAIELDRRDFGVVKVSKTRLDHINDAAGGASGLLPGEHTVTVAEVDPTTGNASLVVSSGATPQEGDFVQRALEHLQVVGGALGLEGGAPEFRPDPNVQVTSSGSAAVHANQHHDGIPVFQAAATVRFATDGALSGVAARSETVSDAPSSSPSVPVEDAVRVAAQHVTQADPTADDRDKFGEPIRLPTVDVEGFEPRVIAGFEGADRPTTLEPGPFGAAISASLTWFKLGGGVRLGWEVTLPMPEESARFRTVVDAHNGEVLYCRDLLQSVAARGNVYRLDGSRPRQVTEFPLPWDQYGVPVPPTIAGTKPVDWVHRTETDGNAVIARLGDQGRPLPGSQQGGVTVFDPSDADGDEQKILNIFYYCSFMHDFFYLLGFREADGNFQRDNFGQPGFSRDPVDARAYQGPVHMTASMLTFVDGTSPIMKMGLVQSTGRHTAFDATIVFHEYTHGVTNRLVGGPGNVHALDGDQSRAMGEGFSDYFACALAGTSVVAAWVVNKPGGIRGFPYDTFPAKTENFGRLGTGRYTQVHDVGEIWCAALLSMNRRIGATLGMQLVVDALKLAPANPSFLNMRDAILLALADKLAAKQVTQAEHDSALAGIWQSFADLGMGPGARSNGFSLQGVVADFSVPPGVTTPGQADTPPPAPILQDVEVTPSGPNLDIHLAFRDETWRADYEVVWRGWLAEYQVRATAADLAKRPKPDQGGKPAGPQGESYGFGGGGGGLTAGERYGYPPPR